LYKIFFSAKSSAKLQQIFELCKFFGKKSFQQFLKVVQNFLLYCLFSALYIFQNVQKFPKIKKLSTTGVYFFVNFNLF